MSTTIDSLTPDKIRVKEAFKRLIPANLASPGLSQLPRGNQNSRANYSVDPIQYELLTQADFLREYDVNSHLINSMKYYPNPFSKDSDNKVYQKIKSRVAVGFQSRIHTKRLTALIGNNVNHRLIRGFKGEDAQNWLADFREGWEEKSVEVAIHEAISADGKVGDAAICFYLNKNTAAKLTAKLHDLGCDAYIIEFSDMYYVSMGSASSQTAAEALYKHVKSWYDGDVVIKKW